MDNIIININKPLHITSSRVVSIVKRVSGAKKVGHTGTLDPLASGVLPICLGEATKIAQFICDFDKEYEFEVTFGEERSTHDQEGEVLSRSNVIPSKKDIEQVLPFFTGEITQIPPKFSAIKIDGKRAYDMARDGVDFEMKSRKITIHNIELIEHKDNKAKIKVSCSKGTYIRSLAYDIALKLGSLGYVSKLTRTRVGKFLIKNAISLDIYEKLVHNAESLCYSHSINEVLDDIPAIVIDELQNTHIRQGKFLDLQEDDGLYRLVFDNKTCAIAEISSFVCRSKRIFNY